MDVRYGLMLVYDRSSLPSARFHCASSVRTMPFSRKVISPRRSIAHFMLDCAYLSMMVSHCERVNCWICGMSPSGTVEHAAIAERVVASSCMIEFMRAWNHAVKQVTPEPNAGGQAGGARGCG